MVVCIWNPSLGPECEITQLLTSPRLDPGLHTVLDVGAETFANDGEPARGGALCADSKEDGDGLLQRWIVK